MEEEISTESRRLAEIPQYVNWYQRGAVTRPYDQGGCGNCWSFSAVSAVESMGFIEGVDKQLTQYSV